MEITKYFVYCSVGSIGKIIIDENDNLIGQPDYNRWNKAKWYQKLIGYFFYSYKRKFIDMKGIGIKRFDIKEDG